MVKQVIVMRRDLKMRKGKIAAQAGHACVEAVLLALLQQGRMDELSLQDGQITLGGQENDLWQWFNRGVTKICVYVDSEEELLDIHRQAAAAGLLSALIQDHGMTEFHGVPTYTCLAIEPAEAAQVDPITGGLPLY